MEDLDKDGDDEDGTPDSDDCHIIPNNQATTAFVLENVGRSDERLAVYKDYNNTILVCQTIRRKKEEWIILSLYFFRNVSTSCWTTKTIYNPIPLHKISNLDSDISLSLLADRSPVGRGVINGNHDSGYAASNMEEGPFPVAEGQLSPKQSLVVPVSVLYSSSL